MLRQLATLFVLCGCGVTALPVPKTGDVGPSECVQGPEYWCQNLMVAKSCGAVKHCIQEVWKHISLPEDKNDICDTCKEMVKEARDQLQSNETQDEIKQVFEGTCRIYFPIKTLAEECIKFVDGFIPELIEMLAERMDPQLVCSTAGLCNGEQIKLLLSISKPAYRLPTPNDCQDCKKFAQDASNVFHNMSKDDVQKKMLDFCSQLGGEYSFLCRTAVKEDFDKIYNLLDKELNPDAFCQLVGMCDETTNIFTFPSLVELFIRSNIQDPECEFCEQLVQHLKDMITANSTEEEVKEMLLGLCKNFGAYQHQCEQFISDNFQEIYDFITDEMDPHTVCSAFGLCPNAKSDIGMTKLVPATKRKTIISNSLNVHPMPQLESNDINAAASLGDVNDVSVGKVKTKLPFSRVAHLPTLPESLQLPETRLIPQTMVLGRSKPACALCEYALHELQNILMENKTEEAIKQALDRLCAVLPQTLTDQCTKFIDEYGDAILALLAQEIDPSQVCITLKLCPGTGKMDVKTKFPFHKAVDGMSSANAKLDLSTIQLPPNRFMPQTVVQAQLGDTCETCQFVMGVIHVILGDNKTKDAIEHALETACSELPASMKTKCTAFVEEYGTVLLAMLEDTDPAVICSVLTLCSSKGLTATVPIKELKMGECDVCQLVVNYIDKLLEEQSVEQDITKVLEKVCHVVPPTVQAQCETIIDTYGPYVLQLLGQLADSNKVCQAIDLCARPAGQVHLIGGNKCLYGPSYWCQSKVHAKACKAETHCKQHVWKI